MHNQICLYYSWLILLLNWVLIGGRVLVSPLETGIPKWDKIILERFLHKLPLVILKDINSQDISPQMVSGLMTGG